MDLNKLGASLIERGQGWLDDGQLDTGLNFIKTGALLMISEALHANMPGGAVDSNQVHANEQIIPITRSDDTTRKD